MRTAVGLADYFIDHARYAFDLMYGHRSPTEPPRAVLRWLMRKRLESFTVRDAWRGLSGQTWAETADDVRDAITTLADHGWVRPVASEPGPGRPSERYECHPSIYSADDDGPPLSSDDGPPPADDGYEVF